MKEFYIALQMLLLVCMMITSCGAVRNTATESTQTKEIEQITEATDEEEFINPFGHFTVKKIDGKYTVVPDVVFDEESIREQLVGGWGFSDLRDITPQKVGDLWIAGSEIYAIFREDGKVTYYWQVMGEEADKQTYNYYVEGNQLVINRDKYLVCYIDSKIALLVKDRGDSSWFLQHIGRCSDDEMKRLIRRFGFEYPY